MSERIWECKIGGETGPESLPPGSDMPMRSAIARAYRELTGYDPDFIFSGWDAALTDAERAVVEDDESVPVSDHVLIRYGS